MVGYQLSAPSVIGCIHTQPSSETKRSMHLASSAWPCSHVTGVCLQHFAFTAVDRDAPSTWCSRVLVPDTAVVYIYLESYRRALLVVQRPSFVLYKHQSLRSIGQIHRATFFCALRHARSSHYPVIYLDSGLPLAFFFSNYLRGEDLPLAAAGQQSSGCRGGRWE